MFRIVSCVGGFRVDIKRRKWYGRSYWEPYIKFRGSGDPYYYSSFESAMACLFAELKFDIINNSKDSPISNKPLDNDGIDLCGYFG